MDAHPDLDTLADAAAGVLDDAARADLDRHLAGCAACRAVADVARTPVPGLAATLEEPVPADVADRIDAALASERQPPAGGTQTVIPLPARRPGPTWAGLAAAVVVVLLGVGIGLGVTSSGGDDGTNAASGADAGQSGRTVVSSSGRDYADQAAIAAALPGLLHPGAAASQHNAAGGNGTGDRAGATTGQGAAPGAAAPNIAATPAPAGPGLDRLRDPANLASCVANLAGRVGVTPRALDYARFQGSPALVLVLPSRSGSGRLDVYVVGPTCDGTDIRFFRFAEPS